MMPPEHTGQARAALRMIVAERGPQVLSQPAAMANLLKDLLPDDPRLVRMFVAAADDQIADVLNEHVSQGMDSATAARLAASIFKDMSMFPPELCAWVVGEIAIALGLLATAAGPPTIVSAPESESPAPDQAVQGWRLHAPTTRNAAQQGWLDAAGGTAIAYVACETGNAVIPVDLSTGMADDPIVVGEWPKAIAVTPDRRYAYVASYGDDSLTPIDISSASAGAPISTGRGPVAVAVAPDGATAYVANEGDDTVTPVNVASGACGEPIPTGSRPYAIAIAPDGARAYVVNNGEGTVTPISLASGRP